MAKIIKGGRIIQKKTEILNQQPTIPNNNDHTSGWLNTDIYTGELFLNINENSKGMWFRGNSGITRIATLDDNDKLPIEFLTNNSTTIEHSYSVTTSVIDTIDNNTQYVIISGVSSGGIISNVVKLDNLESIDVNIIYISINLYVIGGTSYTIDIKDSNDNTIKSIYTETTSTEFITLMWDKNKWNIQDSGGGGLGNVIKVGTVSNNRIGIWNNSEYDLRGDDSLTYTTNTGILGIGSGITFSTGGTKSIKVLDSNSDGAVGGNLVLEGGGGGDDDSLGGVGGDGGEVSVLGGVGGGGNTTGGAGGTISISGGLGAGAGMNGGAGGNTTIKGGNGGSANGGGVGGNVYIYSGLGGLGEGTNGISGDIYFGTESGIGVLPNISTPYVVYYDSTTGKLSYDSGGSGSDVTKLGITSNNQVTVWSSDGIITGTNNFTYTTNTGILGIGSGITFSTGGTKSIKVLDSNSDGAVGGNLNISSGRGGDSNISAGNGGNLTIMSGDGGYSETSSGFGGLLKLKGGYGGEGDWECESHAGGNIVLEGGDGLYGGRGGPGGKVSITGGFGGEGEDDGGYGGSVFINGGLGGVGSTTGGGNGSIYIGTGNTNSIYIGNATTIPTIVGTEQILYVDANYKLRRGANINNGITFSSGGTRTITISNGLTTNPLNIVGQTNSIETSTVGGTVNVVGGAGAGSSGSASGGNGGSLNLKGGEGGSSSTGLDGFGGDVYVTGGNAGGSATGNRGGNVYVSSGNNGINSSSVFIYGGISPIGSVYLGFSGTTVSNQGVGTNIFANLSSASETTYVAYNTTTKRLTYGTPASDQKFKKDLNQITNTLNKINQITGYTFRYNDDAYKVGYFNTGITNVGLIAQEVELVFPDVVRTYNIPDSNTNETYKMVEYDKMVAILIESIKELKTIVDTQQIEIDLLKNK